MRVLITGGAGYIGSKLIQALAPQPKIEEIVIYDNLNRGNYNLFFCGNNQLRGKVKFVSGDILDTRTLAKWVNHSDVIYHLAAKVLTPFADQTPHEFDQVNNWGTAGLTYLVESSNESHFIYLSSTTVYGATEEKLTIDSNLQPRTFYGISKKEGEDHVRRFLSGDKRTHIFRSANVYGYAPSLRFDSVVNKFMMEANFTSRIEVYGDGNQMRSFIHVDRLSDFLSSLPFSDLKNGTYNLVESSFAINDLVVELIRLYPELEVIHANQGMKVRSLQVTPDDRILGIKSVDHDQLYRDLLKFKNHFSF
jgi:UDP-glucose 4-epimerase